MDTSILNSTKKILNIDPAYTQFDQDILTHINAVFSVLQQLGVGPVGGFFVTDNSATWDQFLATADEQVQLNLVKSYVFLKVRMLFDPPTTSFLLESMNKQIGEFEWRLNVMREETGWTDPNPAPTNEPTTLLPLGRTRE
jgi:hypothetical protein